MDSRIRSALRPFSIVGALSALLLFALASPEAARGQDKAAHDHRIQVKLTPTGKAQFVGAEGALPLTVSDARTGIEALDRAAQAYGATKMERVFRPAGTHEPRHVKRGLDRWYTVQYQSDAAISKTGKSRHVICCLPPHGDIHRWAVVEPPGLLHEVGKDLLCLARRFVHA